MNRKVGREPSAEKGLTLLELLVALGILALLAVLAVEAFRVGGRAWDNGERRAEEQQRLRILYGRLARDLASVQPVTAEVGQNRVLAFQGKPDRLMFFSGPDGESLLPLGGMTRGLAYFVEPGKGLLVRESYPLVEGVASFEPKEALLRVLDPRVRSIRFRYLVVENEDEGVANWVEEWDSPEVPAAAGRIAATILSKLPRAVEVTMLLGRGDPRVEDGSTQTMTFRFPIRVGAHL